MSKCEQFIALSLGCFLTVACAAVPPAENTRSDRSRTPGENNACAADVFGDVLYAAKVIKANAPIANFGPEKSYGPPSGGGEWRGSLDVFVLGEGGVAVYDFAPATILDGPGPDLKIFENPFRAIADPAADTGRYALDLAWVSFSADGQNWVDYPWEYDAAAPGFLPDNQLGKTGLVGLTPVYADCHATDASYMNLASSEAGGDAFDLAATGLERARFVRITDGGGFLPDGAAASNGADIDAIAVFFWE